MTGESARQAVREVFGDTATVDVTAFPQGRLSLTVRSGSHTATLDGSEESGWGWTADPGEDEGFTGHTDMAASLGEALRGVREAIRGAG